MRFCLVGPTFPYRGGIAHYTTMLAQQLGQHGHLVSLYSFSQGYPRLAYPGRTDRDPSRHPLRADAHYLIKPWHPWAWARTARCMAAEKPDAVLIEWWVPYWAFLTRTLVQCLRQAHVPVVIDCQNILPHERHVLDRTLTALALRQASACLVYSATHRQELLDLAPGMPHALAPFPLFGAVARAHPGREQARRRLGLDGPVALFFGFVRPYKGLPVLLHALARVVPRLPVRLLIVGEFWQGLRATRQLIRDLGLGSWVTIVDRYVPDDEIGLYFAASDLVVMPYLQPVQSGVLALAHAFQKPVIASRVGGLVDGLVEGKTGLLVDPNDPDQLAQTIVRFFEQDIGSILSPHLAALSPEEGWGHVIEALVDMAAAARQGMLPGWSREYH